MLIYLRENITIPFWVNGESGELAFREGDLTSVDASIAALLVRSGSACVVHRGPESIQ